MIPHWCHAIKAPSREAASAFHLAVINFHEGELI